MKLKYYLVAAIIFSIFAETSYAQRLRPESKLIGNWEFVNPYNGRGLMMQLNPDHSLIIQMVLADNYKYRVEGNKLITTLVKGNSKKAIIDTSTIVIKNNSLISYLKKNGHTEKRVLIKTRESRNNKKSIVGIYTWKYPNGHTAITKFTKDGYWKIRLPLETIKGNYSVKDTVITFNYTSPKSYTEQQSFHFKDNTLILTRLTTGKQEFYNKVDYFLKNNE